MFSPLIENLTSQSFRPWWLVWPGPSPGASYTSVLMWLYARFAPSDTLSKSREQRLLCPSFSAGTVLFTNISLLFRFLLYSALQCRFLSWLLEIIELFNPFSKINFVCSRSVVLSLKNSKIYFVVSSSLCLFPFSVNNHRTAVVYFSFFNEIELKFLLFFI